ncbi:MAG: PVC-type heme-binding CxxCH protein [Isosphaeraceae bacterium]
MKLHAAIAGLVLLAPLTPTRAAGPPETVASTPPRTPAEEKALFHLPEGFVAELVASEPEIHKPMNLAFDDLGRLWVTDTIEYPYPAPEGRTPRDSVKILSDFGPDGRARKITKFADGLNIPIGVLPMPSGREALVHSIPNVSKLTDTDGDGKADRREPLYQRYGFRDTHGMTNAFTWGFDGWVYACHGFSNESTVQGRDNQPITMQSGNTYRMREDGSHLEYFTHGQVNPFGLAFDPLGNLYSADCHSRPIYQLLRGAWYPSFGKPHDGMGFGPEMTFHDHGSTGIGGIVYYAADQFPKAFQDTLFIGNVVTSRINHDTVDWKGSTPRAVETPDFLVSDDPWFRPVDLELGPDGALYVADFYNRIIGHYEVPLTHPGRDRERGRIWRIVYRGKDGKAPFSTTPTDWTTAAAPALIEALGHPNLAVRMTAANQLVTRIQPRPVAELENVLRKDPSAVRRVHALWVLERFGSLSEADLAKAAGDSDRQVRVHAMRVLGEASSLNEGQLKLAREALQDTDPFVRRAAAEALGRHPEPGNLRPLLALRQSVASEDTHLLHVVRMALRDQLRNGEWPTAAASGLNEAQTADLADVAPGTPTPAAAGFLLEFVRKSSVRPEVLLTYLHHVARYLEPGRLGELVAFLREKTKQTDPRGQVAILKAVVQGREERGEKLPEELSATVADLGSTLLESKERADLAAGIELAGTFRLAGSRSRLAALSRDARQAQALRNDAMAALVAVDPDAAVEVLGGVLSDPSVVLPVRERAATLLAQSGRPNGQRVLVDALPTAPDRVQSAIAAGLAGTKSGAEALLNVVAAGKASARLLQEPRVFGPLGNSGAPNLKARLDTLLNGLPPTDARLNALIARRRASYGPSSHDVGAGLKVFETQCASCHQIGGKGAKVGPQLDGIGGRGPDRLMEDILDPGRNVDQSFRMTNLALKDGRVVSGLLLREEGAVLVMADAQGKEVRVPAETVEERRIVPLSPMPANLAEQIPEADFFHLIDYLVSKKPEPATPAPR